MAAAFEESIDQWLNSILTLFGRNPKNGLMKMKLSKRWLMKKW